MRGTESSVRVPDPPDLRCGGGGDGSGADLSRDRSRSEPREEPRGRRGSDEGDAAARRGGDRARSAGSAP